MGDGIAKALEAARERARQAEAFYKHWAQRAEAPGARLLFGELGAAKHGQCQALEHLTPADVARSPDSALRAAGSDARARTRAEADSAGAALALALTREEAAERLYSELADLGGEAATLLRSLAAQVRAHIDKLRALSADMERGSRRDETDGRVVG
jgi:rubrerythrin